MTTIVDRSTFSLCDLVVRLGAFSTGPFDLDLRPGSVTVVMGPNGSGKTSLLRALAGVPLETSGSCLRDGKTLVPRSPEHRASVGYLTTVRDESLPALTVAEYWRFVARLRNYDEAGYQRELARIDHLADLLDVETSADCTISTLSAGNFARAHLVAALIGDPDLLLLDEPFANLDLDGNLRLRQILANAEAAVLLSAHDLDAAVDVGDQILIVGWERAPELLVVPPGWAADDLRHHLTTHCQLGVR